MSDSTLSKDESLEKNELNDMYFAISDILDKQPDDIADSLTQNIAGNIFSDDILQLKLNTRPLTPNLDKIDSLELENLDSSLDLCPTNQITGLSDVINIIVTDIPESSESNTSYQIQTSEDDNTDDITENSQTLSEAVICDNDRTETTEILLESSADQSDVSIMDWSQNWLKAANAEDDPSGNYLQPIVGDDGIVSGYYVINAVTGVKKVIIKDESDAGDASKKSDKGKVRMCKIPGCGKMYKNLTKYKLHVMMHSGEKPYKCMVPDCKWAFATMFKLKRHLQCHEGKKDFLCTIEGCGRRYTTIHNLNCHMKIHTSLPPEECTECGKRFVNKRLLLRHLKTHENLDRPFKCTEDPLRCQASFFSQQFLDSHSRKMHRYTKEELTCSYCGKEFPIMCQRKLHEKTHTGDRPYACTEPGCLWRFITISKLNRHLAKHSSERQFRCSVPGCDKTFKRSEHLKVHLVKHQQEFVCTHEGCEARFGTQAKLERHIHKHTEPTLHECPSDGCVQIFISKPALRRHLTNVHGAESLRPYGSKHDVGILYGFPGQEGDEKTDGQITLTNEQTETLEYEQSFIDAILPSEGITFRDPETGAIFIHTQLLQDDPPHTELFALPATTINISDIQ